MALQRRVAELSGSHPAHATVRHGMHEWARDDDGEGRREVHCNTCEGAADFLPPRQLLIITPTYLVYTLLQQSDLSEEWKSTD